MPAFQYKPRNHSVALRPNCRDNLEDHIRRALDFNKPFQRAFDQPYPAGGERIAQMNLHPAGSTIRLTFVRINHR